MSVTQLDDETSYNSAYADYPMIDYFNAVSVKDGKPVRYAKVSVHKATNGNTLYCIVHFFINGKYYVGSGKATGSGYNRVTAAFHNASENAGFKFETDVVTTSLKALGEWIGFDPATILLIAS